MHHERPTSSTHYVDCDVVTLAANLQSLRTRCTKLRGYCIWRETAEKVLQPYISKFQCQALFRTIPTYTGKVSCLHFCSKANNHVGCSSQTKKNAVFSQIICPLSYSEVISSFIFSFGVFVVFDDYDKSVILRSGVENTRYKCIQLTRHVD